MGVRRSPAASAVREEGVGKTGRGDGSQLCVWECRWEGNTRPVDFHFEGDGSCGGVLSRGQVRPDLLGVRRIPPGSMWGTDSRAGVPSLQVADQYGSWSWPVGIGP